MPEGLARLRAFILHFGEPGTLPTWLRRGLIVAVWAAALAIFAHTTIERMATLPTGKGGNDGYLYLRAASNFISNPGQLYDNAHQQVESSLSAKAFVHPPSGLIPYLPFAPLVRLYGIAAAGAAWTLLDALALVAAVVLAGRRFGLDWLTLGGAALLISITDPVASEVVQSQINGLVLFMVVLAMVRMPHLDAGVYLALGLAFKPVAAILLLVPLLRRRPAITGVALGTLAVTNLAFVPLIGVGSTLFYLGTVLPFFAGHVLRNGSNVALPFVLQRDLSGTLPASAPFGTPVPGTLDAQLLMWVSRLAVLVLWFRACVDRRLDVAIAMALTLATVPFLSSTIWPHYLIYLFPLALATLAASQLWVRVLGVLSLVAMLWGGRGDALWVSIVLLWIAAAGLVIGKLGWRLPAGFWRASPQTQPSRV